MQAPKCKQCGSNHWPREAHRGEAAVELKEKLAAAEVTMKATAASVADLPVPGVSSPGFDREAYHRVYMKAYMRKRRAAAKGSHN